MVEHFHIRLDPYPRGYHQITSIVLDHLGKLPKVGILNVFVHHTSAGIMINENADPSVARDFEKMLNYLVPENLHFLEHTAEGSDDMPAHIKAAIIGSSVQIPFDNHSLLLGTWQGIFLCEFRNHARERHLTVSVYS